MPAKENKLRGADSWLAAYDSPEDKLKPGSFGGAATEEGACKPWVGCSLWRLGLQHHAVAHFSSMEMDKVWGSKLFLEQLDIQGTSAKFSF